MKSYLYIWCTYYGETLYEESSVYMVYIRWGDLVWETLYEESCIYGVHTMGRPCMKIPVYMVYILWGDLV